jgi:hypothetical protein
MNVDHLITKIRRTWKKKPQISQTRRDNEEAARRRQEVGAQFEIIKTWIDNMKPKMTIERLKQLVKILLDRGVVNGRLDRLCWRRQDVLICWFCKHRLQILQFLSVWEQQIQQEQEQQDLQAEWEDVQIYIDIDFDNWINYENYERKLRIQSFPSHSENKTKQLKTFCFLISPTFQMIERFKEIMGNC